MKAATKSIVLRTGVATELDVRRVIGHPALVITRNVEWCVPCCSDILTSCAQEARGPAVP